MFQINVALFPTLIFLSLSASVVAVTLSRFSSFSRVWLKSGPETKPTPVRALPASWYTTQEIYELERRAIFSKKWLLTTHQSRLPQPGDWLRYEIAGFQFVIARDRTGQINAFHNICRHRAFPVVTEEKGNNKILACQYHNWSYGLNGKLAKAPGYQELKDFDRSKNGLFPIHVHLDKNGFIFVNLDAAEKPSIAWDDDFHGIDDQARFKAYNFEDYVFDHTWQMEGEYNWKILADNYNECYHCPTAHPDIPTIADLNAYAVKTEKAYIQHLGNPTAEQIAKGFNVAATYYFPNASMNVSPHFFFLQRFVPKGPNTSVMSYEVYRNKSSSDDDFNVISDIYKRIMSEDKYLCSNAQKNINAGVFVNGEMHPMMEQGPLFFQSSVRNLITAHHKQVKKAKHQIWPAQQNLPRSALTSNKDIKFCSAIKCPTAGQKGLDW